MMSIADQTILLADSTKFGVRTFAQVIDIQRIGCVITDNQIDESYCRSLEEKGVQFKKVIVNR